MGALPSEGGAQLRDVAAELLFAGAHGALLHPQLTPQAHHFIAKLEVQLPQPSVPCLGCNSQRSCPQTSYPRGVTSSVVFPGNLHRNLFDRQGNRRGGGRRPAGGPPRGGGGG